jgi:hypothetical protein
MNELQLDEMEKKILLYQKGEVELMQLFDELFRHYVETINKQIEGFRNSQNSQYNWDSCKSECWDEFRYKVLPYWKPEEGAHFTTYLHMKINSTVLDFLRKKPNSVSLDDESHPPPVVPELIERPFEGDFANELPTICAELLTACESKAASDYERQMFKMLKPKLEARLKDSEDWRPFLLSEQFLLRRLLARVSD